MYAKRLNKTYVVETAQEKKDYLARGYDIYDDDDELLEHSPQKSVPYSEYAKLLAQYSDLQSNYQKLETAYEELLTADSAVNAAQSSEPEVKPTPKSETAKMGSLNTSGGDEAAPNDALPDEAVPDAQKPRKQK